MKKYPPLISIGGPLLGLLLVIFLINTGINRLQADQSTLREEARLAQSDVAAPEAAAPAEAAAPEAAAPEAITPEAAAPEVATPEVAAPAAEATPEAATPLPPAAPAADQGPELTGEALKTAATAAIIKGTCTACHTMASVPGAVGLLGPNLDNVGATAGTRVPGLSASDYLHQSIIDPNAFIAPDCPLGACLANVMLPNLADILTPDEIDTIVAYLSTLKTN
ncbi:MAG: c-type cytochrome [Caldilineaceae bacterium]|nr:c-type cytochrome [Caldilineaceae bacterium]MBP8108187.1 c-type cytochrome [Caldilineaceae bacterium]MBP8125775.1 c-type cytochrome [Caldilineaceae bacterium]MBP9074731.1 c-type cytochrome [Caldilineaceae bacterium]